MAEEPDGGAAERPKILNNVTGWIGGLTGVVIALAGLRAAYKEFVQEEPAKAPVEVQAAMASDKPAGNTASAVEAKKTDLPLGYTGKWDGAPLTLDRIGGVWVEKTGELVTHYEQLSREEDIEGMTFVIDRSRQLYVKWPNKGGIVEQSPDNEHWDDYYYIKVAKPEQSAS